PTDERRRPTPRPPGARTPGEPPPKATFDQTAMLWTSWTLINLGGKPNPQAVSDEAQKQLKSQGLDPDRAKAVGDQIALEMVPVVKQGLQRAQQNTEAKIDWGKLDLTLKSH